MKKTSKKKINWRQKLQDAMLGIPEGAVRDALEAISKKLDDWRQHDRRSR